MRYFHLKTLLTALLLLCSTIASAHDFEVNGIYYNILSSTDKTVAVTYKGSDYYSYSDEYSGAVTIPASVTYNGTTYSVTTIGSGAFSGSGLTSVTIPNSVTTIENSAFEECSSLTSVTIPNNVTTIGSGAFRSCTSLTSITIPNSVTTIRDYAFKFCSSLVSVTIPNSVTTIREYAFYECSSLESVTIPNSVTTIREYAFEKCSSLTSVTIPNNVKTIEFSAFRECSSLTSVTIPNSVTTIERHAFEGCKSLTSVTIPNSVTSIESNAFSGSGLTSVTIPNSVTSIEYSAFEGCTSLTSVTIPNSVKTIEDHTFGGCRGLTSVTIGNSVTTIERYAFEGCKSLTNVTIPNSVTTIGSNAFYDCTSLASVTIGNSVTSIEYNAFYNCNSLESIKVESGNTKYDSRENCNAIIETETNTLITGCKNTVIPNSVTTIGSNAFYDCTSLTSVTIPNSVTTIGNNAFSGCINLESITIPGSVTTIGNCVFSYCTSLESIKVESGNTKYDSRGNCNAIIETETNTLIASCNNTIIPNSVTTIGDGAFSGSSLTSITIPNSVTTIGDGAFSGSGLTSITIPNSVTTIGERAFINCSSLASVTIPNSVTTIGSYAFSDCSSLASVTIPNSVTTIGYLAFYYCSRLKVVYNNSSLNITAGSSDHGYVAYYAGAVIRNGDKNYDIQEDYIFHKETDGNTLVAYIGNNSAISLPADYKGGNYKIGERAFSSCSSLASVTIGNSVTSIGSLAFYNCNSLARVTIPNSVTTIGNNAFCFCTSLESVTIPNSVTTIGNYAFYNCSSLASATIPNSVTTIGEYAFYNCSSLASVTIGNGVTTIGNNAFWSCKIKKAIWLAKTPPTGYENVSARTNYVSNNKYTSLSNVTISPYLSSIFEVDGIKYIPINPAERTCDAIDCTYDSSITNLIVDKTVSYKGVAMTVKNIMPYAFCNNTNINIAKANNDGNICESAFSGCNNLTKITLGENVKTIENCAFNDCSKLTEIVIPDAVTQIGNYAFDNCTSLTDVIFKERTTEISLGSNGLSPLFSDCPLDSVYIGGKITSSYGYSPFYCNKSLRTVVITDKVNEIYDKEFYGCSNLISVSIGDGVKKIGNWAFSGCSSLNYFAFGENVQSIGEEAFSDCTAMTKIISHCATPPVCGNQALDDINKWECTLFVPSESKDLYQSAEQWRDFFFIEDAIEEPATPGDITGDGIVNVGDITTIASMILDESLMNDAADINNDGIVNVGDITTLVSMILGSNSAPARAAATGEVALPVVTASMDADNSILINVANEGYPFTAAQFDIEFEGGIGIVNDGEYYDVFLGSRTTSRNHSEPECNTQPDGSLRVVILSLKNKVFDGEEGDIASVTLDLTGVEDGEYQYTIKNIALSDPSSQLQYPADATGMITVNGGVISAVTCINSISAGSQNCNEAIYDLSGRKVANPVKGGIYIKGGKKFIM